jgi:hypothetical protein
MGGTPQNGFMKSINDLSRDYMKFQQRGGLLGAAANYSPDTKRILGPILNAVQQPAKTVQTALEYVGPTADVQDMRNFGQSSTEAFKRGDYAQSLADLLMTGAAVGMTALPGSVGGVKKATDDLLGGATKKADDVGKGRISIKDIEHGESAMPGGKLTEPGSDNLIREYAGRPTDFPPIEVVSDDAGKWMVVDGSHRLEAAKLRGDKDISVIVSPHDTEGLELLAEQSLPLDEASRMARAKEMGFDTDAYHGTDKDIFEFDVDAGMGARSGTGTWLTDSTDIAETYAKNRGGSTYPLKINTKNMATVDVGGANWNNIPIDDVYLDMGDGMNFDLKHFMRQDLEGLTSTNDIARVAKEIGAEGVIFKNVNDVGPHRYNIEGKVGGSDRPLSTNYVVFDPKNIRSKHAKFDPKKRDSGNLLAGLGAALGITGLGVSSERDKKKPDFY